MTGQLIIDRVHRSVDNRRHGPFKRNRCSLAGRRSIRTALAAACDRPQEILDAALTVFVTKGFAATKLDDVAAAAGISKGLLYRYFDNKAELFKEVIRQTLVATIRDIGDRTRASGSALAALDIFVEQIIAVASDARRSAIP